jgi:YD repeat-containing protein
VADHPIGSTKFTYEWLPGASETKVKTEKSLDASRWIPTETYVDGLGRTKRTVSVAAGTVETEYDALGRVKRVSGTGTTPMSYAYDALDRSSQVTYEADNSTREPATATRRRMPEIRRVSGGRVSWTGLDGW